MQEMNGHIVEFIPEQHIYVIDGIITPSVSEILAFKFDDYSGVPREMLQRASERGTELHKAIEEYEKTGETSELKELKNYQFLKKHYGFENIDNEVTVMYERDGRTLYAGTLDQLIKIDGKLGINDFKRVSAPNKNKIAYQLNLYRLAYEQTFKRKIDFLAFTHLREDVRKFRRLPIDEETALELVQEYCERDVENEF